MVSDLRLLMTVQYEACFSFFSFSFFLFLVSTDCTKINARDCREIKDNGFTMSGVYKVTPVGTCRGLKVYCDMYTDGGGWMVGRTGVH